MKIIYILYEIQLEYISIYILRLCVVDVVLQQCPGNSLIF